MNKELRDRQQEQLDRFLAWVSTQGTQELPVRLDTYLAPEQQARIAWLAARVQGRILEVGCNWGYVLACVNGQAGVDINPALVDLASALAPQREFSAADARRLPFPEKTFDTVLLSEVLEHLDWGHVPLVIEEARRVGKKVLITVPNGDLDSEEALNFKHRYLMTRERLESVLVGFSRLGVESVGPFYCVEAWG